MDLTHLFAVLLGLIFHAQGASADSYCYYDDGSYICYHYYYYSLSAGAYAGIVIGCLLIVIVKISLIIVCCIRRRNRYVQRGTVIVTGQPAMGVSTVNTTATSYGVPHGSNQYGVPPPAYTYTNKPGQQNYGYQQS